MKSLLFSCLCFFLITAVAQGQLVNHFEQVEVTLRQKKQIIPLSLPAGTTSYFYSITAMPIRKQRPAQESLYSQALRLIDDKPLAQVANRIKVTQKPNTSVNVILVQGKDNAKAMKANTRFNYFEYFLDQPSGATHITTGPMEDVFLLVENRRIPRKYRVLVEVVAIVE
jgi:hypothetical protein